MPAFATAFSSAEADSADRTGRFLTSFCISWLTLGILAGIVFLAFHEVDLQVSGAFYVRDHAFAGQSQGWVRSLRTVFVIAFWLYVVGSLVGLLMTRDRTRTWLRLSFAQWLFLVICAAMGPGIVSNVILKDHWGRARPKQIVEFGGNKTFTPPLIPTNQCANNCSFVSGEAASVFVPFYAAGLLVPQRSAVLLIAGTLLGFAAGLAGR